MDKSLMPEDARIDQILFDLKEHKELNLVRHVQQKEWNEDKGKAKELYKKLDEYGLIEDSEDVGGHSRLSKFGERIIKAGGWQSYLWGKIQEVRLEQEIEKLKIEKLRHDTKISRFQVKTKWWPLVISGISLLVSIAAFIISLR